MKFVRSDSPEVAKSIASVSVRADRRFPALFYGFALNALILLIAIGVELTVSARAAAWFGVPVFLAWNVYLLWLLKFSSRRWVIAACADRVFLRLFVQRGKDRAHKQEPDVIVFEVPEIASMSIRTLEVFLYGPEPKIVEWLVIEPAQAIAQAFSDRMPPLLTPDHPGKQIYVTHEEGRLTINWRSRRPDLRTFLQKIARECPSVSIAPEERSELDLNGIWHGISMNFDAQQRQMLVHAKRLGFGRRLAWLLGMYKCISPQQAAAYLNELEQEEAGASATTEAREQEAAKAPRSGEQLASWIVALSITVAIAYFCLRVAESILTFSYASMGMRGVSVALAGMLILLGFYAPAYWMQRRNQAGTAETFMFGTWLTNDAFSWLPVLLLLILAVAGSAYLGQSQLPLQTLPLQAILLTCCVQGLSLPPIMLYQTARRMAESGSFLPSGGGCACGKKSVSPWQGISLTRKTLMAAASLLGAGLWTSEVILLIYLRNSPLGKSRWVLADLYWLGIGWWFTAGSSVWQIFHPSDPISRAKKDSVDESVCF